MTIGPIQLVGFIPADVGGFWGNPPGTNSISLHFSPLSFGGATISIGTADSTLIAQAFITSLYFIDSSGNEIRMDNGNEVAGWHENLSGIDAAVIVVSSSADSGAQIKANVLVFGE